MLIEADDFQVSAEREVQPTHWLLFQDASAELRPGWTDHG